jgi:hypothetical protein
LGLSDGL